MTTVYDGHVCNRIPDFSPDICLYDDFKLYLRYSCKGCTTDEHVCGWYADENTDWSGRFIPDSFIAAGDCQFYIYRNEKNDGFIYRGNVLRWN